jgi:hypothetical protein
VLCACFRAPSARYEENEAPVPQIIIHDLDVAKQVRVVLSNMSTCCQLLQRHPAIIVACLKGLLENIELCFTAFKQLQ